MFAYSVKLLSKKEIAEKTTAFFFEKPTAIPGFAREPSTSKNFKFTPGQFIEIHLNNKIYSFSIASSPKEKELMIATRMRPSAFKNSLKKLKTGGKVKMDGPFGQFVLHENKRTPAVFLAGGIGITPFRSMIKNRPNRKIVLFYSNRTTKDAPFLEELLDSEKKNKNFELVPIMTREDGEHINPKMIKENLKNWQKAVYYAVGSTGFVQSMADMLSKMKIKQENIKTENFTGY